jgi:predicted acetyltransferase
LPKLVPPTLDVHGSFLAAMDEFSDEGRGDPTDASMLGRELRMFGPTWRELGSFDRFVAGLVAQELEDTPRPEGFVPSTTLWWVDGKEFIGRIVVRHRLTQWLLDVGGHIGYDVRPSARGQGHATRILHAVLPAAHRLGVDPALLTCDDDNIASRKVIEANGGVFEDQRGIKLRYWLPTS